MRTILAATILMTSLLLHEVTHKGTVVSTDKTSVTISVVNVKTKKPESMKFDFDKETKITRAGKPVTFEAAGIQKGESISVTIDHDADETLAIAIKLGAKKN